MRERVKALSSWKVLEEGKLSGFDYSFIAKPDGKQGYTIIFPDAQIIFQILITENGRTDANELFKWLKPPQGEQLQKALAEAKAEFFSAYSPSKPVENK